LVAIEQQLNGKEREIAMATDMFLKIDDIKGESNDSKHKGEIEVFAWSWGAAQMGASHGNSGSGAGKVQISDLTITKYVDRSTPVVFQMCASGKAIKTGVLTVRKAGGTPLEYIKITFTQAIISAVTYGAGADDRIPETVTFNFASVQFDYVPQKADGSADATVTTKYDIAGNA
jgi:type VI secretion system secreted protein Hcp